MVVGRLLSFREGNFSGAMLNFRWVSQKGQNHLCHGQGCRYIGDGCFLTFNDILMTESLKNWYIKPYYWVDEFIPYYMEIMGV